jgi:hypothetical protein
MEFKYEMDSVVLRSIIAKLFSDSYPRKQVISRGMWRSVFIFLYRKKGASRFCSKSDDTGYSVRSKIRKRFAENGLPDVIAFLTLGDQISKENTRRPVQCNHYFLDVISRSSCLRDLPKL